MAKRMTDSSKWGKQWYRTLAPKMKLFWGYLCDNCDASGVWSEDYALASFQIGETITCEECANVFGGRFIRIEDAKIFIPGFIEFQYGQLSEASKPHLSIIRILQKHGIDPKNLTLSKGYPKGIQTLKEKEKEQEKEKVKEIESLKSEVDKTNQPLSFVKPLCKTWQETLKSFGVERGISQMEETEIARGIQGYGAELVDLALYGYRFQEKSEGYDPAKNVRIGNVFKKDDSGKPMIDRYANLGAQKRKTEKAKQDQAAAKKETEEITHADPARVREIMSGIFKGGVV